MDNVDLSIVIPTYNERENIKSLLPQIEEMFKDIRHEIIVVDDNSPDNTGQCVSELNRIYGNIRLVTKMKKEGIGAALRMGYLNAAGRVILSTDADLSFSVKDMVKLLDKINEGYDLVLGCRHALSGSFYETAKPITAIKHFISRLGNMVLAALTGMDIHDFSANFRAVKKESWRKLNIEEKTNIMLFEMIIKAKYSGMAVTEIPVSFIDRVYGKSKLNLLIEIPKYIMKMGYYIRRYRQGPL